MRGLTALQVHQSLNLHFSKKSPYDCIKYNFKTKASVDTLKQHPNRWQYAGLEKNCVNVVYALFSVYEENNFQFITPTQLFRKARQYYNTTPDEFLDTVFKNDLIYLRKQYDSGPQLFGSTGMYPALYDEYKDGKIHLRTLIILSMFIMDVINTDSKDIIAWPKFVQHCHKIEGFIALFFDRTTVESLFAEHYLNQVV
jgi:hypothetical protein